MSTTLEAVRHFFDDVNNVLGGIDAGTLANVFDSTLRNVSGGIALCSGAIGQFSDVAARFDGKVLNQRACKIACEIAVTALILGAILIASKSTSRLS